MKNIIETIFKYIRYIFIDFCNSSMPSKIIEILFGLIVTVLYFFIHNNCSDCKNRSNCRTCIGCNK